MRTISGTIRGGKMRDLMARQGLAIPAALLMASTAVGAAGVTVRYIPKHDELKYTFGGHAPVLSVKPGTVIESWTEDCYDGLVTSPTDIPSKIIPANHDNPQTGPFLRRGRRAGRHPGRPHPEARAGAPLRHQQLVPVLRRPDRDGLHGHAPRGASGKGLVVRRGQGQGHREVPGPEGDADRGHPDAAVPGLSGRGARREARSAGP